MAKQNKGAAVIQAVFDERIQLPGCPQIIVTRGWAYRWLRDELGYCPKSRGFASLDYLVFARRETSEPLTDLTAPHVKQMLAFIVATENAA